MILPIWQGMDSVTKTKYINKHMKKYKQDIIKSLKKLSKCKLKELINFMKIVDVVRKTIIDDNYFNRIWNELQYEFIEQINKHSIEDKDLIKPLEELIGILDFANQYLNFNKINNGSEHMLYSMLSNLKNVLKNNKLSKKELHNEEINKKNLKITKLKNLIKMVEFIDDNFRIYDLYAAHHDVYDNIEHQPKNHYQMYKQNVKCVIYDIKNELEFAIKIVKLHNQFKNKLKFNQELKELDKKFREKYSSFHIKI